MRIFTNRDQQIFKFQTVIFFVSTSRVCFLKLTNKKFAVIGWNTVPFQPVLRIRIRDPVLFLGSEMEKYLVSGSGMNIPKKFFFINMVLEEVLNADPVPESFYPWIQDTGWKNSDSVQQVSRMHNTIFHFRFMSPVSDRKSYDTYSKKNIFPFSEFGEKSEKEKQGKPMFRQECTGSVCGGLCERKL